MQFLILGLGVAAIAFVFAIAAAVPTWFLWNWLMPTVFGRPSITLVQSFGLLLLSGFLFSARQVKFEA